MMKSETRNAEHEFGTARSTQSRENLLVDGYKLGFGHPGSSRSDFLNGLEPNLPIVEVQTPTAGRLPRPVVYTSTGLNDTIDDIVNSQPCECNTVTLTCSFH